MRTSELQLQSTFLRPPVSRPKGQLLKWIGNKQRFSEEIAASFPSHFGTYFEPFLGSGAVLAALSPAKALASDSFGPLIEIWSALKNNPKLLVAWYEERYALTQEIGKELAYARIRESYNARANGADLLFLSRACYGGVVRFRKRDGFMSTPCGVHSPISPAAFESRVTEWRKRVSGTEFVNCDYRESMARATAGDLVYCDPPYVDSQTIIYGAQSFRIEELWAEIEKCKARGVYVALSIDGSKGSGKRKIEISPPSGLIESEFEVSCGRSMLKRFQMDGRTLEGEKVSDRLLLTF
jgi:DNA adenine methylase